jgi:hypothetical protein
LSIETLVNHIQLQRKGCDLYNPFALSASQVIEIANEFDATFATPLSDAYCRFLRLSNGLLQNGLTIWPANIHWKFTETLITANHELRDTLHNGYVYFGQRDELVFCQESVTGRYQSRELTGFMQYQTFPDADALFHAMLSAALDLKENNCP